MKNLKDTYKTIKETIIFLYNNKKSYAHNTIIKFFFISLGILFLVFQIYSRIILERSPKNLSVFSISLFLVSITVLSVQLYLLRKYINKLLGKPQNLPKNKILQFAADFMKNFFDAYKIFFRKKTFSPLVDKYYNFIAERLIHHVNIHVTQFYFIFYFLPRIIPVLVFFIEVLFFHKITVFYKILWLFLIPILARIIRFMFICFSEERIATVYTVIMIESKEEHSSENPYGKEEIISYDWVPFNTRPEIVTFDNVLTEYKLNKKIFSFFNYLYKLDDKKKFIIINIIITVLLIISWGYVFFVYIKMLPAAYVFVTKTLQIILLLCSLSLLVGIYLIEIINMQKTVLFASLEAKDTGIRSLFCDKILSFITKKGIRWDMLLIKLLEIKELYVKYLLLLYFFLMLQTILVIIFLHTTHQKIYFVILFVYFVEFVIELILNCYYQLAIYIIHTKYETSTRNLDKVNNNIFFEGLVCDKTKITELPNINILADLVIDIYFLMKTSSLRKYYFGFCLGNYIIFVLGIIYFIFFYSHN